VVGREDQECASWALGCAGMMGFLKDGPAAGHAVEVGDPPMRRGVIVLDAVGFGEDAHRCYLCSVDASSAIYSYAGPVRWAPEAGPHVTRQPASHPAPTT
jgi:hypothetical protein